MLPHYGKEGVDATGYQSPASVSQTLPIRLVDYFVSTNHAWLLSLSRVHIWKCFVYLCLVYIRLRWRLVWIPRCHVQETGGGKWRASGSSIKDSLCRERGEGVGARACGRGKRLCIVCRLESEGYIFVK